MIKFVSVFLISCMLIVTTNAFVRDNDVVVFICQVIAGGQKYVSNIIVDTKNKSVIIDDNKVAYYSQYVKENDTLEAYFINIKNNNIQRISISPTSSGETFKFTVEISDGKDWENFVAEEDFTMRGFCIL